MGWPPLGPDDVATCGELARRALQRAAGDPTVMAHCGLHLLQARAGSTTGAWRSCESAAAVPTRTTSALVIAAGIAHLHCGSLDDALALLPPRDPASPRTTRGAHLALTGIAHAHIVLGDHAEALVWAGRSLARQHQLRPHLLDARRRQRPLGRIDEARRHLAELRGWRPSVTDRQHPRRPVRQGPGPHRADPRRTAPRRAAGGIVAPIGALCSGMADGKLAFGPFMLDSGTRRAAARRRPRRPRPAGAGRSRRPGRDARPDRRKEDLLARAWPGTIVEEGNLTVQIAALRKALGPGRMGGTGS